MIEAREDVYQAIFDLVSATPGFKSSWRRFVNVKSLPDGALPALMMRQVHEQREQLKFGIPPKYTLMVELQLVVPTPVEPIDSVPASIVNPLVDAIEKQIAPLDGVTPGNSWPEGQQLGINNLGLLGVSRLFINGDIEFWEAISEGISYAYVPLTVVCV